MKWHVYMISLEFLDGRKSRHYGNSREYYVGVTGRGVNVRMGDYLYGRGQGFVNKYWRGASKRLVFVEVFEGSLEQVLERERFIKGLSRERKEELIDSGVNGLVGYFPLKGLIVLREGGCEGVLKVE